MDATTVFNCLSSDTRLKILSLLVNKGSALFQRQINKELGDKMTEANLSIQLHNLCRNNLIECNRLGKYKYYSVINVNAITQLLKCIEEIMIGKVRTVYLCKKCGKHYDVKEFDKKFRNGNQSEFRCECKNGDIWDLISIDVDSNNDEVITIDDTRDRIVRKKDLEQR